MEEDELWSFLTYYYLAPAPERAALALDAVLEHGIAQQQPLLGYLFGRIANEHPQFASSLQDVIDRHKAGESALGKIFRATASDPTAVAPGLLDRLPRDAAENDALWTDFTLTGSQRPILRLIDVLDQPDLLRAKLESWLATPTSAWSRLTGSRERVPRQLRETMGIAVDLEANRVTSASDCDLRSMLDDLQPARPWDVTKRNLPVRVEPQEVEAIATKVTAAWSLGENAVKHPAVLDTVRAEAARRPPRTRITLLEISALVDRIDRKNAAARATLSEALTLDATRTDLAHLIELLADPAAATRPYAGRRVGDAQRVLARPELDRILALVPEQGEIVDRTVWEAHRLHAADVVRSSKGYRSKALWEYREEEKPGSVQWLVEEAPEDRFRVEQVNHSPTQGDLYDSWVVVEGRRYVNAGLWMGPMEGPEEMRAKQDDFDRRLKLDSWRPILELPPDETRVHDLGGERYLRLGYAVAPLWLKKMIPDDQPMTEETHLWLRWDDDRLVRAEATASRSDEEINQINQAFCCFDADVAISEPVPNVVPSRQSPPGA